jgi:subtilase family serine protease
MAFGFAFLLSSTAALTQPPLDDEQLSQEAAGMGSGQIVIPHSGIQRPGDIGIRAHTLYKIFVPAGRPLGVVGFSIDEEKVRLPISRGDVFRETISKPVQPIAGYYAETPASLACIYQLVGLTSGCNPGTLTMVATGGSKAIAIVDAYDYPTAVADLTAYSRQFGLPAPTPSTFSVTYPGASKPPADPDCANYGGWDCWATESALDIEMAHAAAPSAHIYLVEASSSDLNDLFAAIATAVSLVRAAGGGEVSMSWGGSEFPSETQLDATLTGPNVVFFAASGDSEGTIYPSVSPNVIAVGGTTIARNPFTMAFESEVAWEDTGGGYSVFEPRPSFQSSISAAVGAHRGVPDVAAVSNPRTGVWVYNTFDNTYSGQFSAWNIIGGTSVASPLWAGIANHAAHFSVSTSAEETLIYASGKTSADFRDVTVGSCGYYEGYLAVGGWDPCSGFGAPLGSAGK